MYACQNSPKPYKPHLQRSAGALTQEFEISSCRFLWTFTNFTKGLGFWVSSSQYTNRCTCVPTTCCPTREHVHVLIASLSHNCTIYIYIYMYACMYVCTYVQSRFYVQVQAPEPKTSFGSAKVPCINAMGSAPRIARRIILRVVLRNSV